MNNSRSCRSLTIKVHYKEHKIGAGFQNVTDSFVSSPMTLQPIVGSWPSEVLACTLLIQATVSSNFINQLPITLVLHRVLPSVSRLSE